jgi:hypothetical protein
MAIAQRHIGEAGALVAQLADGRDPTQQRLLRIGCGVERAILRGLAQDLTVVVAGMQGNVGVGIDESGHYCAIAEIDDPRPLGRGAIGADGRDFAGLHCDQYVLGRIVLAVEEVASF